MRNHCAIILFLFAMQQQVISQKQKAPTTRHKLVGTVVPSSVKKWMPKRGKSRAFAKLQLNSGKSPVWAHFYDVKPLSTQDPYYNSQECSLDVLIHTAKPSVYKRLNTIPISYQRWHKQTDLANINTLWLDPQRKSIPIIRVRLSDFGPYSGRSNGSEIFLVFRDGLTKTPVIQQFGYGVFTGGTVDSLNLYLDAVDDAGNITIKQVESSSVGRKTDIWKWTGSKFQIAETSTKSWDPE